MKRFLSLTKVKDGNDEKDVGEFVKIFPNESTKSVSQNLGEIKCSLKLRKGPSSVPSESAHFYTVCTLTNGAVPQHLI